MSSSTSSHPPRSLWWMMGPAFLFCAPLVAIAAVYMVFKLGFFIGGSVLSALIASGFAHLIYRDRLQGAHASNMGQTAASACGSLAGIVAVIMQVIYWLDLANTVSWPAIAMFTGAASMLGIGIGMVLTPLLVDHMRLTFPSGMAVYQILTSLMSWEKVKRAIGWLGGGILGGFGLNGWGPAWLLNTGFDAPVVGAGLIVGARIALPGLILALIGWQLEPTLVSLGWLEQGKDFRFVGFYAGLAMMVGAATVQVAGLVRQFLQRRQAMADESGASTTSVALPWWVQWWTTVWALVTIAVGVIFLDVSPIFLILGVVLSFVFVLVNGISTGVADANPVTGAFTLSALAIVAVTSVDSKVALLFACAVLLITIAVGVDMQQDRSTGWRLGSDRTAQFWFQVVGAVLAVPISFGLGLYFMTAYPELQSLNTLGDQWSSAFTVKVWGALQMVDGYKPWQIGLLMGGGLYGAVVQLVRQLLGKERLKSSFLLDAVVFSSPYAFSFGAFVPLLPTSWFAAGGVLGSLIRWYTSSSQASEDESDEIQVTPLVGGGLIAGGSLAVFWMGIASFLG